MNSEQNNQEMELRKRAIDETFCFHCHYSNIAGTQNAYSYYKDNKKQKAELYKSNIPIAIDTNVLLDLYSISFEERKAFLKFINENAHRIIIASQVQQEYMNHRTEAIQAFTRTLKEVEGFPKKVLDNLKQIFDSAVSQLKSNGNRLIVKNDMVGVEDIIKEILEFIDQNRFSEEFVSQLEAKFAPLVESVKNGVAQSMTNAVYELDDPVLQALSKTTILSDLSQEEKEFLRGIYDKLLEEFNEHKEDINKKDQFTFPGCGDRKKIKDGFDPYGDFFIYHELLSYMWHQNKDVVFLTKDVTKSDWIKADGKPFNHYIVDTYVNTGHMLYIHNASDFTTLSFEAVAEVNPSENDDELSASTTGESDKKQSTGEAQQQFTTTVTTSEENNQTTEQTEPDSHYGNEEEDTPRYVTNNYSYLQDVSEERFLHELEAAELWAMSYGDGYVGQDYFIYSILGHKRFHYGHSIKVMQELRDKGLIEVEEVEREGRRIKSLKTNKGNNN